MARKLIGPPLCLLRRAEGVQSEKLVLQEQAGAQLSSANAVSDYALMKAFRSLMAGCGRTTMESSYPAIWKTRSRQCCQESKARPHRRRGSIRPKPQCFLRMAVLAACVIESKAVTVQWDPNSEPDLAGYKLHYGQMTLPATIVNTTNTSVVLTNLTAGKTYYFYATAYNTAALESSSSAQITYTVPQSSAPTISDIPNQSVAVSTSTGPINFSVNDSDTPPSNLVLAGNSSNTSLVPNNNISFGGSGNNRTVAVAPAAGQTGTATISVTVSDGSLTASDSFLLTVSGGNTPPRISNIADQSVNEDTATAALNFSVSDAETAAGSLIVSGNSSNGSLVPNGNISFGGSGSNRTVRITPATNQSGTSTVTVTVTDGSLAASDSFVLTVNPVNDSPTI